MEITAAVEEFRYIWATHSGCEVKVSLTAPVPYNPNSGAKGRLLQD